MNWVVVTWSMIAAGSLTLALVHGLIWCWQRAAWSSLLFSAAALFTAAFAGCELWLMTAETPEQVGLALQWAHVPVWLVFLSLVAFTRVYLRAGRLWLAWTACALRTLALLLNFAGRPNLNFREITEVRKVWFLGERVSVAYGVANPWMLIGQLSLLLFIIFVADATLTAWRRGERRQALMGGSIVIFVSAGMGQAILIYWGIVHLPLMTTPFYMGMLAVMAYGLSRDIVRNTELSDELRQSRERLNLAAETPNFALWGWDIARDEIWMTLKGRALLGLPPEGPLNQRMLIECAHPEDRDIRAAAVKRAVETQGLYEIEFRVLPPDGGIRWIASRGHCVSGGNGHASGLVGTCMDVTERKLAEEAAHALSGRLIQAQEKARAQLARDLHDDLNQGLALLSVELEMFGQNPATDPAKIAARMAEFSSRAKRLASEVHQLSHELHPVKLDQLGLVAAMRGFCEEFTLVHQMVIDFTARDVPGFLPDGTALCLYRITQEALHNVVKHSGGTAARVEITYEDGQLRLSIADDGAGFDPAGGARCRFARAGEHRGAGALCGWASRDRFPSRRRHPRGSACAARRTESVFPRRLPRESIGNRMTHRPRILLADDHILLLAAFRCLLEPQCEIVGMANDGRALIDLAESTQPEIIILDVAMPGLNGLDACAQIRRKMPEVRLIFLTVNEDPDVAAEAIHLGASGYLLKHSATSELFTALEYALAGKTYLTPLVMKGLPLGVFLGQAAKPGAEKLTPRQREVLPLLAEGRAMKEIADLIQITPRTVAFHKYTIMEQLGLKTNADLLQYAVEHGLIRKRVASTLRVER